MASSALLSLVIVIGLLSICATARPCKTLFISTYTVSFKPYPSQNPNPNDLSSSSSSSGFLTVFTEIRQLRPYYRPRHPSEFFVDRGRVIPAVDESTLIQRTEHSSFFPLPYDFSSLRDRTKDILSVVIALLFGVGCGALTAATMYLVWSLFSNRYDYRSPVGEYDGEASDDEIASPKKMGYVLVPAAAPVDSISPPIKDKEVA
ncbi:uncharacterized protein LOC110810255 [Carica papaya]|uniref:uncharacterized protein LOC110810255 n=1 Tax=Carica papaya TaxID=3649 RepID=UPI000B8C9497|nr:uncharacterized protein LOC110810255 [Carica papaya]